MLGTGVRIGESLAVLWHQVAFEAGTVEVTRTIGGFRDLSNTRRALRTALSPVGSTARRDLGTTLKRLAATPT